MRNETLSEVQIGDFIVKEREKSWNISLALDGEVGLSILKERGLLSLFRKVDYDYPQLSKLYSNLYNYLASKGITFEGPDLSFQPLEELLFDAAIGTKLDLDNQRPKPGDFLEVASYYRNYARGKELMVVVGQVRAIEAFHPAQQPRRGCIPIKFGDSAAVYYRHFNPTEEHIYGVSDRKYHQTVAQKFQDKGWNRDIFMLDRDTYRQIQQEIYQLPVDQKNYDNK